MNMDLTQEIKRNAYDLAYLKGLISNENTETSWAAIFPANPMRVYKKAPRPYSRYLVNRLGQVKGPLGKVLKPYVNNAGYSVLPVTKNDGKSTTITVSRLVALTWLNNNNINELTDVDHINGDLDDNCVDNLQWLSHPDNLRRRAVKGGKHAVTAIELTTGKKTEYSSISAAARSLGISYSTIRGIAENTYTLPDAGGYSFIFVK
ncbi:MULTISPECIES: NUMOD1 domain-containing DNA-binding protein [Lacticaseibacillus]|jgi:hypothetical protein|uniref:NUMOD1 domain-containing DNA-binding protein n=1 Tax=Lacticaseibacillus TaxID=2759736 RepID=UPI0007E4D4BC|nr:MULTISPECIES: NUMOD1 domain-containing DNA-binding protein [Lacticaseibacillus]MBS0990981.1 hypothetical protein [Lacticaseibacillus paracasei]MDE3291309.1 hypothetical protein [Lacticaseibacillus paracasei]